jgi:hypothetical protein
VTDLFFETMKRLKPTLRAGNIQSCERVVAEQLRAMPPSPFHLALDLDVTNDPADAARHFDEFFARESRRMPKITAAYTEMNGFDINPDQWFCDLFAYAKDGGHDDANDYDWLAWWDSGPFDVYEINGFEPLQAVYAEHYGDHAYDDAAYMSNLAVVVKFQRFIQQSVPHMIELRCPLYVTAHDYNFIARFEPHARAGGC